MRKRYYIMMACCVLLLSSGIAWALYWYKKPHRNVAGLKPEFKIEARELYGEYKKNGAIADRKFAGKVVEVKGTIAGEQLTDSTADIQLSTDDAEASVSCNFLVRGSAKFNFPSRGAPVTIKGRCTGYLQDVNLVDCVIE
jgi:hypothetical protein